MAGNTLTLEFAGDAAKLQSAAQRAQRATMDVAKAAETAGKAYKSSADDAGKLEKRLGNLGAATTGATDAIDGMASGAQALADAQDYARSRAARLERANSDVAQATEDMAQATRDAKQAQIDGAQASLDLETARLDQKEATKELAAAVKEHGVNSMEAKRAEIELKQAGLDVKQAKENQAQATRDASQANIDAKDAQLNLNDAMHEADPPELQEWADKLAIVGPLLSALVGVTTLVTAAQWAWNAATLASPITWIVIGIAAVIAGIVLLVKNWDKVKAAAGRAWDWIRDKTARAADWLGKIPGRIASKFGRLASALSAPFRAAFNRISDAWNSTVGRLSWTVPSWVPGGIGGNSISAPRLPRFHTGGVVPGIPGQEVPIMALAGERVSPSGRGGGGDALVLGSDGSMLGDALVELISMAVRRQGGNVQLALGGRNA